MTYSTVSDRLKTIIQAEHLSCEEGECMAGFVSAVQVSLQSFVATEKDLSRAAFLSAVSSLPSEVASFINEEILRPSLELLDQKDSAALLQSEAEM